MNKDTPVTQSQADKREDIAAKSAHLGPTRGKMPQKAWLGLIVGLLVGAGIAIALLFSPRSGVREGQPVPSPTEEAVPMPSSGISEGTRPRAGEMTIVLSQEEIESTQVKTAVAIAQVDAPIAGGGGNSRTTATVMANAYNEVPVISVAGGMTKEVKAQLGDKVRQGQHIATIFSPELASAQGDYLKMVAELQEHHRHHERAMELAEIGAMSRDQVDEAVSKYKSAEANVSPARQRLILLGMSGQEVDSLRTAEQIKALISVRAPVAGTVVNRAVNPGELVAAGKELFRVADLASIWVVAQIYESDFAKVRIGTAAIVTTAAYPDRTFTGRVSYIDSRVDTQSRTAQVRIEVPNPGEMLKIGMFVDVILGGTTSTATSSAAVAVPGAAIQNIGTKQVAYVASDRPGTFVQRDVIAGPEANGLVVVHSGINAGERVVTEGSFLLRAESLKLNPEQSTSPGAHPAEMPMQSRLSVGDGISPKPTLPATQTKTQNVRVVLAGDGFRPQSFTVRKDIPVRLTFIRQVEVTCGTEVAIPEYEIKRELPLNEPVIVEFTPSKSGTISFACGMNMLRGTIVVK